MDRLCKAGAISWSCLIHSNRTGKPVSACALDCLCQTAVSPWLVSFSFYRTLLLFLLLCKIIIPGPVGALLAEVGNDTTLPPPPPVMWNYCFLGKTYAKSYTGFVQQSVMHNLALHFKAKLGALGCILSSFPPSKFSKGAAYLMLNVPSRQFQADWIKQY